MYAQRIHFAGEFKSLHTRGSITKSNCIISIKLFIDKSGLLQVSERTELQLTLQSPASNNLVYQAPAHKIDHYSWTQTTTLHWTESSFCFPHLPLPLGHRVKPYSFRHPQLCHLLSLLLQISGAEDRLTTCCSHYYKTLSSAVLVSTKQGHTYVDMNVTKQQSELYSKPICQSLLIHTGELASC